PLDQRRTRRRRRRTQQPAPQDTSLEDTRRSAQLPATLTPANQCCDDPLNAVWLPASVWCTSPARPVTPSRARVHTACSRAPSTSAVVMLAAARQPVMRRENASITNAT